MGVILMLLDKVNTKRAKLNLHWWHRAGVPPWLSFGLGGDSGPSSPHTPKFWFFLGFWPLCFESIEKYKTFGKFFKRILVKFAISGGHHPSEFWTEGTRPPCPLGVGGHGQRLQNRWRFNIGTAYFGWHKWHHSLLTGSARPLLIPLDIEDFFQLKHVK